MRLFGLLILISVFCLSPEFTFSQRKTSHIQAVIDALPPLSMDRDDRELIYQYSIGDLQDLSDDEALKVIDDLAKRGLGVITFWRKGDGMDSGIKEGIRIARLQDDLGLSVVVDATQLLYGFYDGTSATLHLSDNGEYFADDSFAGRTMGCPFTLQERIPLIKARVAGYAEAYESAGIDIDIITADWEIDGPIEWNEAWSNSKKCVRCRANLPNIRDFLSFQSTLRSLRSNMIYKTYTKPLLEKFPGALITNYATYPNGGWRYWYDHFEYPQPDLPHKKDQEALYRPWYNEFTETGFTLAMPVIYTWYSTFNWYPEYSSDYRWFYNLLKVGSNAGQHTPSGIPIASFLHWHTTVPPKDPDPKVTQMSRNAYKELLWHLLFRSHDIFYSWCMPDELIDEMLLLQDVYNSSLKYNDWLKSGRPIIFDVPKDESSVISGIKWGDRVLIRRTDFNDNKGDITINVEGSNLVVPYSPGECQILSLSD